MRVGNSAAKVVSHPFDFGEVLRAIVVWEWDPDRDRIIASRNLPTVYGTTTLDRESSGMTLVHPDDVERHQARVFTAVERGRGYRSSFRIVRPDTGGVVAIEERAEAIARGAGTSPILVGLAIALGSRREHGSRVADITPDVESYCDAMLTAYATALRAREPSLERTGAGDWVRRATRRLSVLESAAAPTIADARTALARARVSIGSTMNLDERAEY